MNGPARVLELKFRIAVNVSNELGTKPLAPSLSFLTLGADDLVVTAMKKANRADALVMRVFEPRGGPRDHAGGPRRKRTFRAANLPEEDLTSSELRMLRLSPYEIRTVLAPIRRSPDY